MKDLDKFDMIVQAHEYEEMDKKPGFLQQFFDSTNGENLLFKFFLRNTYYHGHYKHVDVLCVVLTVNTSNF